MRFLHGALTTPDLFFCLWGEAPRSQTATNENSWPYSLADSELRDLLRQTFGLRNVQRLNLTGWFPKSKGVWIPSSPLIEEYPKQFAREIELKQANIDAVGLSLTNEIDLLATLEKQAIEPGIFCAPDLLYWAEVVRFCLHIVIAQKFIPSLEQRVPMWRPVLLGEDRRRFDLLTHAMPASCRSFSIAGCDRAPKATATAMQPRGLLWRFLERLVNAIVREQPAAAAQQHPSRLLHDQWLHALADPAMPVLDERYSEPAIDEFRDTLHRWTAPLLRRTAFDYRLAFRLEEPNAKRDQWYVRYFLQNENDPSLLIPLDKIWKYTRSAREVFGDQYELAMQNALVALAQAGKLDPQIEMSLTQPRPSGHLLNSQQAWEFLNVRATILRESGFGILLPSWWGRQQSNFRLGLKVRAKEAKQSFSATDGNPIIDFDWKLAIGKDDITFKELMALAKLKTPLVKFRGRWIELPPEQLQAAIDFWNSRRSGEASLFDLLRLSAGVDESAGGLPVTGVEASGWLSEFLHDFHEHAVYKLVSPPPNLHGSLRDYQHRGFSWLHFMKTFRLGACLADDMGLGKTVETIALLLADLVEAPDRKILLICPTSVVGNWQRELTRFAPSLRVSIHHGGSRKKGADFHDLIRDCDIVLSSYSLLLRDIDTLQSVRWRGVVLDEAQNIKNAETKQARSARSLQADYRIALTGTPVENNIGELWSIFEFLNPGLLGTRAEFRDRFFIPIHRENNQDSVEQLRRATGPFLLRRLKTDPEIVTELPEKNEMKTFCNLTREQATLYAAAVRALEQELDDKESEGIERKGKILASIMKLKQICNHPAHFLRDGSPLEGRSGKLARLTEMVEEAIESGDRILIFTQFVEMGELLKMHLQNYFGREVAFLHGGITRNAREKMVDRFNNDPDGPPIFLLSLKAGGVGLNLTRANHVFHFDRWWNPAVEDQATDRAFRIGQTKNVQVHKLICIGTLEERIDQMIERKKAISGSVIASGETWLTELSTSEIKSLVALGKDAVSV